ncbi:helix-turn-helix domain-containing protein [Ligilactobacillus salivarius]|uniref:Transcriptional regulator n=1 Tax=Ligilactobacillus salivarius TaxID=1624 RepID=A0A1V9R2G4_9LACO|nr:helix-turn-helix transcriptional regulator [Ligilactobacillus salivarius]OQQ84898.1 transcriptional regulator [Ligilactobacillus salivarius]OQQ87181.1 transcriptional regulator [Ligilactobacillus salivarius]TXJ78052.1 helix-turn-helix transcriptional regulator [Ligilactobacillus salivarius]
MPTKDAGLLGLRIKKLRKEKGLRQSELATTLHVSQQAVGSWETGRTVPGADTLNVLADYFNVTTDYLLGRPEKKKEKQNVELTDDDIIMTYQGKELSDEDREIIKRLMNGK